MQCPIHEKKEAMMILKGPDMLPHLIHTTIISHKKSFHYKSSQQVRHNEIELSKIPPYQLSYAFCKSIIAAYTFFLFSKISLLPSQGQIYGITTNFHTATLFSYTRFTDPFNIVNHNPMRYSLTMLRGLMPL